MQKGPNKKFDIVKVRDSGYSRQRMSTVKLKLWQIGVRERKKRAFFVPLILSKGNFLTFAFYLKCVEYTFRKYILLHIKKYYFIHFCRLFLKPWKTFSVSFSKHFLLYDLWYFLQLRTTAIRIILFYVWFIWYYLLYSV